MRKLIPHLEYDPFTHLTYTKRGAGIAHLFDKTYRERCHIGVAHFLRDLPTSKSPMDMNPPCSLDAFFYETNHYNPPPKNPNTRAAYAI